MCESWLVLSSPLSRYPLMFATIRLMKTRIKLSRWRRLLLPKQYDHTSWLLMEVVGRWWLLLHGWKREHKVYVWKGSKARLVIIDLAHPKLKIALEADGAAYHMDVVRDMERGEALARQGWTVRHFRYQRIKQEPRKVRREVRRMYWQYRLK